MKLSEAFGEIEKKEKSIYELKQQIKEDLTTRLENLEKEGRKPQIIYDTYLENLSLDKYIERRQAMKAVSALVDEYQVDGERMLFSDGTYLGYRYQILNCKCGSRYSNRMAKCPNCKN